MPISFTDLIYNYTRISAHISIQIAFKDKPFTKIVQDPEEDVGCLVLTYFVTKLNNSYKSSFFAVFLLTLLIQFREI